MSGRPAPDYALIESLLFAEGTYARLELHLERLHASAAELGFRCDGQRIRSLLAHQETRLGAGGNYKVRLLLEADGSAWTTAEPLPGQPRDQVPEVMLADFRLPASEPLARHKTTRRAVFDRYAPLVRGRGLHDVIFLNDREELAEAANSNVFLEIAGELLTPPPEAGILPGVYRRWLLKENPRAREAVLNVSDLREAEGIYLSNSVRGWRRVTLRPGVLFDIGA